MCIRLLQLLTFALTVEVNRPLRTRNGQLLASWGTFYGAPLRLPSLLRRLHLVLAGAQADMEQSHRCIIQRRMFCRLFHQRRGDHKAAQSSFEALAAAVPSSTDALYQVGCRHLLLRAFSLSACTMRLQPPAGSDRLCQLHSACHTSQRAQTAIDARFVIDDVFVLCMIVPFPRTLPGMLASAADCGLQVAKAMEAQGQLQQAADCLERLCMAVPRDASVLALLGSLHARLGSDTDAFRCSSCCCSLACIMSEACPRFFHGAQW